MKKLLCILMCAAVVLSCLPPSYAAGFDYSVLPAYSGEAFVKVNGGVPFFTEADFSGESFEYYSELDSLGRCGAAFAAIGFELMPTEERGNIGGVKPSGWQSEKYDVVDGKYLYNRCHLIGYQLTAENANKQNLITGTRYLNVTGMLPFENMTADFIKEEHAQGFDTHVLYRVTPVFVENELVARGVLMEALSVEDDGEGVCFCVFCYNVQPGIVINYRDGTSRAENGEPVTEKQPAVYTAVLPADYVLNVSTKKIHLPSCANAQSMTAKNRKETTAYIDGLIAEGYTVCKICKPDENGGETVTYLYGDIDLNGRLEAADARLALRAAVGLNALAGIPAAVADVDFDGGISAADARGILRAAVGLEIIEITA